jgi:hypothetical protein
MDEDSKKPHKMIDAAYLIMGKIAANMIKDADELIAQGSWTTKEADMIAFIALMTSVKVGKNSLPPEVLKHAEIASDELAKKIGSIMADLPQLENFINAKSNKDIN